MTVNDLTKQFEQLARVTDPTTSQQQRYFKRVLKAKQATLKEDHMVTKRKLELKGNPLVEKFETKLRCSMIVKVELKRSLEPSCCSKTWLINTELVR